METLTAKDAGNEFPKPVSEQTVRRYIKNGKNGVKLKTTYGKTSRESIIDFLNEISYKENGRPSACALDMVADDNNI